MRVGRGRRGDSSHEVRGVRRGGRGRAGGAGASGQGEGEGREAGCEGRRSVRGQVVEQPLGEPHVNLRGREKERGSLVGAAGVACLELLQVLEGGACKQPPTLGHLVQMSHCQLLQTTTNQANRQFSTVQKFSREKIRRRRSVLFT